MDWAVRSLQNVLFLCGSDPRLRPDLRKKVVVLGTGWGAMNFIKRINVAKYDVAVVSPRNYFTFTPLLPSACAGTLSPRSCLEPVRNKLFRGRKKVMDFYEGWATELDLAKNSVVCKSKSGEEFNLPYDYLVVAVGAEVSTFGIPGVAENAHFLKEVENARAIRKKLLDNLEQASLPVVSEEAKKKLLHFVIVGGGPTGVETAAEISDFIREDASKHFPSLIPYIKLTLVEMLPKVLPMFSRQASEFGLRNLRSLGIDAKMECRVTGMSEDSITLVDAKNQQQVLPCSFVLWASGVGQVPFAKMLLDKIPQQKGNRVVRVNERLQVIGAEPRVYGMGDCTYLTPEPLEKHIDWLYEAASKSSMGPGSNWLRSQASRLSGRFPQLHPVPECLNDYDPQRKLDRKEFGELLNKIDKSFKAPPPTAQTANQEGRYLATIMNHYVADSSKATAPAFVYNWKGSMAYVGRHQSVIESPWGLFLGGIHSHLMWRGFYWSRQMSINNKTQCLYDWLKAFLRGRDVAREHSKGEVPRCPS